MPVTFDDIVGRSRVRHGMISQARGDRRPSGGARRVRDHTTDSYEGARGTGISSHARSDLHGSRRTWAIHPSLREAFSDIDDRIDDAELEADGSGDTDVVDCEVIASGSELRRWRLSLTDFHALLAGGTEAIAAYRSEQRRKEDLLEAEAPSRVLPGPQSEFMRPAAAPMGQTMPEPKPSWGTRAWRTITWPMRALVHGISEALSWMSRRLLGA